MGSARYQLTHYHGAEGVRNMHNEAPADTFRVVRDRTGRILRLEPPVDFGPGDLEMIAALARLDVPTPRDWSIAS